MIISTVGSTPGNLANLVCAATSFDDVKTELLPALADDLDADSAGFYQAIRQGDSVRLGHTVALTRQLLDDAGRLQPLSLRSLNGIHLVAAQRAGDTLRAVVTYNARMLAAAADLGITTFSPR
jgi:hypothetical protein